MLTPKIRHTGGRSSGIFVWIKSFNACLWRALTSHIEESAPGFVLAQRKKKKRPTALFFTLRIHQAISWIRRLLAGLVKKANGDAFQIQRWFSLAHWAPGNARHIRHCSRWPIRGVGLSNAGKVCLRIRISARSVRWLYVRAGRPDAPPRSP